MQFNTALGFFLCGSGSALLMSGRMVTNRTVARWWRCLSWAVDLLRIRLRQEPRDRSVLRQVWHPDCDILSGANVTADLNLLRLHRRGAGYLQGRAVQGAVDRDGAVDLYRGDDHLCGDDWLPLRYRNCLRMGQLHPHGDAHCADIFYPQPGLLVWTWQQALRDDFSFIRWLPASSAITLMAMIAITSSLSLDR